MDTNDFEALTEKYWEPKDFFIYPEFEGEQEETITFLHKNIMKCRHTLLDGPNGVGKTIISLSSALPTALNKRKKIIFLLKTHSQNNRIRDEIEKIREFMLKRKDVDELLGIKPEKIICIPYKGKKTMCINSKVSKSSKEDVYEICKRFRKDYTRMKNDIAKGKDVNPKDYNTCVYYDTFKDYENDFVFDLNPPFIEEKIPTTEDFLRWGRMKKICPYFLQTYHLNRADIIICNYFYIFHRQIMNIFLTDINVSLEDCILVIDECHNIPETVLEINTATLNLEDINKLLNTNVGDKTASVKLEDMIKKKGTDTQKEFINILNSLKEILNKNNEIFKKKYARFQKGASGWVNNPQFQKKDPLSLISQCSCYKDGNNFLVFLDSNEIDELNQYLKREREDITPLDKLRRYFRYWVEICGNSAFFPCISCKTTTSPSYKIIPLDPQKYIFPLLENSYSSLHLSGTVEREIYVPMTGLNRLDFHYKNMKYPYPFENKRVFIIKDVSTTTEMRKDRKNLQKINQNLYTILSAIPEDKNIAIFLVTYSFSNSLNSKIISKIEQLHSILKKSKRESFITKQGEFKSEKIKKFRKSNGGILIDVMGGRNSEGVDFKGKELEAVIILGVPLFPYNRIVKAKSEYYEKEFSKNGDDFSYHEPAIRKVNQAVGRLIRSKTDKGLVILMGKRFVEHKFNKFISDWIKEGIVTINLEEELKRRIIEFWKNPK